MEIQPNFANSGKAYLVGLTVTDDPASLGTEMLAFSASATHNPLAARKTAPDIEWWHIFVHPTLFAWTWTC